MKHGDQQEKRSLQQQCWQCFLGFNLWVTGIRMQLQKEPETLADCKAERDVSFWVVSSFLESKKREKSKEWNGCFTSRKAAKRIRTHVSKTRIWLCQTRWKDCTSLTGRVGSTLGEIDYYWMVQVQIGFLRGLFPSSPRRLGIIFWKVIYPSHQPLRFFEGDALPCLPCFSPVWESTLVSTMAMSTSRGTLW